MPAAVRAEGPLYLRIRPNPVPEASPGAGSTNGQAVAGRESVWERADRRARLAIASVCTGCLDPGFLARPSLAETPVPVVHASRVPSAAMAAADESTLSTAGAP